MITQARSHRVDPRTSERWHTIAHRHGSLFNAPPWIRAITDAFDLRVQGEIVDGANGAQALAWAELDDPAGRRRSTLPFCDYFDPMSEGDTYDWDVLGRDLIDDVVAYSIRLRERTDRPLAAGLRSGPRFGWHAVDLRRPLERIWAELPGNARQGIRRARRLGAVAGVETDPKAVEEFRCLHVALRRAKYGMLAQPPEFFEALRTHFGSDALAVVSARREGQMTAGVLLLRWADTAYYKLNASTPEGTALHANDLCMWTAIEHAKREWHAESLDLGLSDLDQPGLLRYKEKYASERGSLISLSNEAAGLLPHQRQFRAVLNGVATVVLADGVPEEVGVRTASQLYRYFC